MPGLSPQGEAYAQGLKFLFGIPTFWRGLKSKSGVKMISADAAIYDEFDEADQSQLRQARERLSASTLKLERELSVPTLPDWGINKRFQETNQMHYAFKCQICSKYNILEDAFPNCFQQEKDGSWFHACTKCKRPLDIRNPGVWVIKNLGSRIRGYQISQLYSPMKSATDIMNEYHSTEFMGHFYNHTLGLPYLSATDRVSFEQVLSLCNPLKPQAHLSQKRCVMGIDVGSKLHCVVMNMEKEIVALRELKDFEELDHLMKSYNVIDAVIDALPETRKSREFVSKWKQRAWMCFYSDHQKGSYGWNEEERIVSVNRTESLDAGTTALLTGTLSLPQRDGMVELFATHAANIAKVTEEDKESGSKRAAYKKIGPDHFRHALNYCQIAFSKQRSGGVASVFR